MFFKKVKTLAVASKPVNATNPERGLQSAATPEQAMASGFNSGAEDLRTLLRTEVGTMQSHSRRMRLSIECYPRKSALAAALTNSPNGERAWRLPTLPPLLGEEGRGEGELYPNCNDTAEVRAPIPLALIASLFLLAITGCSTVSQPASASFAAVTIHGHTEVEIASATVRVFQEDGYMGGAAPTAHMTFQKEGSRMQSLAYEGLVNSHEGAVTLIRVKTEIVPLGGDGYRLQCQAYTVRSAGDRVFEEEQRVANIRSGPYQSLLNKVAKELKK